MRAAVLEAPGRPLRIEELAEPAPGPGEVLVSTTACGVCHTDLHVMKGEVAFPTPAVLGHEVSGTVSAVGPGVESVEVGDRVVASFIMPCGWCRHCVRGAEDLCETFFNFNRLRGTLYDGRTRYRRADGTPVAMYSMGGLAERCVVPATDVFGVPEGLPVGDVAILGCSMLTAYGAVHRVGAVRPGDDVAVVAVGGVGSAIIQLALVYGAARIIAVDVSAEKLKAAEALGATHTVDASAADPVDAVRAITEGRGVAVAFEALGSPQTFAAACGMADDGGAVVVIGIAPAGTTGQVDLSRLPRRKLRILGSYGGRPRTDMPALLRLVERGVLRPQAMVSRRFGLDEAGAAYEALDRGEIVGRAVVDVAPG
jgi:S-(hydroxymethyl)glutathione dehydrogenase/alcohol dehydrogenase